MAIAVTKFHILYMQNCAFCIVSQETSLKTCHVFKNILPSAAANKAFILTTETLTGRIHSIIEDSNKYMYVHGSQHRVYYMGCNVMNINCFCSITVHTSPHHVMEILIQLTLTVLEFPDWESIYCKQENSVCNNTIVSFLILS